VWGIGGMIRRLWKNSDDGFDRPVGLYLWRPIGVELQRLKDDISKNYKDLVSATASQNTGITKWVESITYALNSVTSTEHGNLFSRAKYIQLQLQKSLNDLQRFTGLPNVLALQRLAMKASIMEHQLLVQTYYEYCTGIESYVKGEFKWKLCPLSQKLQKTFGNKASRICEDLGATLEKHLVYINIKDILGDATDTTRQGLSFLTLTEKLKLQEIVQEYQRKNENDLSLETVTPIRASLAKLRTCFESSDNEE
jgi:hypothetical protein